LLTVLTVRKCGHKIDYFRAARRDVRHEKQHAAPLPNQSSKSWEAIAREPTPAEAVALAETVELLLRTLDERQRAIVSLSLQGSSPTEISTELGCSERTVQRVLKRVKEWLQDGSDGATE
jgi:RNA polymerase sigma factor (sigma-70 family)